MSSEELQEIRKKIEAIDRGILEYLHQRMEVSEHIAQSKIDRAFPFRDQPREEKVLLRVRQIAVESGLDPHAVEQLYRFIMEMSIARQQAYLDELTDAPLRVAYQGVEGSYTHITAQRRYRSRKGGSVLTGYATIRKVVAAVKDGTADVALLPLENTTAGSINESYDALADGVVTIKAEVISRICHCLLAIPGTKIEDVRTVLSHPQAFHQCSEFLATLPAVTLQEEYDPAYAARIVKESGRRDLAAIASENAAKIFGLDILQTSIQSREGDYTRFVEVALEASPVPPEAPCKTSLVLKVSHTPGSLGRVLTEFGQRNINLVKLESRPHPGSPFQYRFYLDLEGHGASKDIAEALHAIQDFVEELRVIGTYPRDENF